MAAMQPIMALPTFPPEFIAIALRAVAMIGVMRNVSRRT
jgi:hypothetical protein